MILTSNFESFRTWVGAWCETVSKHNHSRLQKQISCLRAKRGKHPSMDYQVFGFGFWVNTTSRCRLHPKTIPCTHTTMQLHGAGTITRFIGRSLLARQQTHRNRLWFAHSSVLMPEIEENDGECVGQISGDWSQWITQPLKIDNFTFAFCLTIIPQT
jgi:hypothetical protein